MSNIQKEYPMLGAATVEAAIMGYGVIAYDHGYFYVVWWENDQSESMPLPWGQCHACGSIYASDRNLDCPTCFYDTKVEVA